MVEPTIGRVKVEKQARYFVIGDLHDQPEVIWFVCHGYGYHAKYFIKHFEVLLDGKTVVVAPEALHRFYVEGYSGNVGASWMTKEDRLSDIEDYVNYLDIVYKEILNQVTSSDIQVNVLGFSQGGPTVCRWMANKQSHADNLVIWAGTFPHDFNFEADAAHLNNMNVQYVIGNDDQFASTDLIEKQKRFLSDNGIEYAFHSFLGKHEINSELLVSIALSFKTKG